MEGKMNTKIAGGLVVCGLVVVCGFSLMQAPKGQPQGEGTRLIESIQGPALYTAYCAVCHGKDGKGSGPMATSLKIAPPDLTRIAAHNSGKFPLARLQKVISGEEPIAGGHGTREMPVWGPIFSQIAWDQDLGRIRVYNLAKYIEQMQAK
jgi:mono/diheme cytochrome c family protein